MSKLSENPIAKSVSAVLKRPYPLRGGYPNALPTIAGWSLTVPAFLIIFQPFGLSALHSHSKNWYLLGMGLVFFCVLSISHLLWPRLLRFWFDETKWTVGKQTLWYFVNCISVLLAGAVYWLLALRVPVTTPHLTEFSLNGLLIILFLIPSYVMFNHIRLMKSNLRTAEAITRSLPESPKRVAIHEIAELCSETNNESIRVPLAELLFIQSWDNYANIVTDVNGKAKETLLRASLKQLEAQFTVPYVIRCHRSYIVNLLKVKSVSGNAREFILHLENYTKAIPVSRAAFKKVARALENLALQSTPHKIKET